MAPILMGFSATSVIALATYWWGETVGLVVFTALLIATVILAVAVLEVDTRNSALVGGLAGLPVLVGVLVARRRRARAQA